MGVTDTQVEIESSVFADVKFDSLADDCFKIGGVYRDSVNARAKRENGIKAVIVRLGYALPAGLFVAEGDFGLGNFQPGRILDQSRELRILCEDVTGPHRASQ